MSSQGPEKFHISQGLDVLTPKSGRAYPIPCGEWDYLKNRLKQVSRPPWLFQSLGFSFLGATLSTFITIITGRFSSGGVAFIVAWSVVVVTGIVGIGLLVLAHQQRKLQKVEVAGVIRQMELIEERYEKPEA